MHLHHSRCFQEHVRILLQSLRALCKAPGGAGSIWKYLEVVLATGLGNPPAVQFLAGGSVRFGSLPSQKPDPLCLGGFVTRTGHKPEGFRPGWNWTAVPTLQFLHLCLQ